MAQKENQTVGQASGAPAAREVDAPKEQRLFFFARVALITPAAPKNRPPMGPPTIRPPQDWRPTL